MSKSTTLSSTLQLTSSQTLNDNFFKVNHTRTIEDYDNQMKHLSAKNKQDEETRSILNLFASERLLDTNLDQHLEM